MEKFKPLQLTYTDWDEEFTRGYVEGSALKWRWAVPYDADGLISLFKNREYFVSELNNFFDLADPQMAAWNPGSYYWHGNEPDIHTAYLFNYAGRPDLTQKWVRWILDNKYDNTYIGIDGNDDAATLSAWYIFSSLGFYPVTPGMDYYVIGSPSVKSAKLHLPNGKEFVVNAVNASESNCYIQSAMLNGQDYKKSFLKYKDILKGGILDFDFCSSQVQVELTL